MRPTFVSHASETGNGHYGYLSSNQAIVRCFHMEDEEGEEAGEDEELCSFLNNEQTQKESCRLLIMDKIEHPYFGINPLINSQMGHS